MRAIMFGFLLFSCLAAAQSTAKPDPRAFVAAMTERVAPMAKAIALNYWEATATGRQELYARQGELELQLRKVFADRAGFEALKAFRSDSRITDPLLRRQIEVLYLSFLENQIDPELMEKIVALGSAIEGKFNTHRAEFEGKKVADNTLAEVLKTDTDEARRKAAWEASKTVGAVVVSDLLQLVRLRNEAARQLGFRNYYEMRLAVNEQDPREIGRIFEELAKATEEPFLKVKDKIDAAIEKRFGITRASIRPHHYQDFFFQEIQEVGDVNMDSQLKDKDVRKIAESFYNSIGLSVTAMLDRSDLYEREGKYQHAYCTDIDRHGDVRTMCSLRNNRYWLETLMHELGHGVYCMNIDRTLPWLLREEAHTFTTEAIAELFGTLPTNPVWLKKAAGIPGPVVDTWAPTLELERKMGLLIFCRWSLVMLHFERALYENPDQDLNRLWWDLVEKYQKVRRPDGRNLPDWAAKIHLASYPVYYHNYMLGNLLASQLLHYMASKITGQKEIAMLDFTGDKRLGKYLQEAIFAPGKTLRWDELIRKATGEPLTAKYFAMDVAIK